jgi:hypothetical protein
VVRSLLTPSNRPAEGAAVTLQRGRPDHRHHVVRRPEAAVVGQQDELPAPDRRAGREQEADVDLVAVQRPDGERPAGVEDESTFSTVRRLVQSEDDLLRVMRSAGIPTAEPYGFPEITPEWGPGAGGRVSVAVGFIDRTAVDALARQRSSGALHLEGRLKIGFSAGSAA